MTFITQICFPIYFYLGQWFYIRIFPWKKIVLLVLKENPPLGDLPDPGSKTWSPTLQADSLLQNHQGSPLSYVHTHKSLLRSWFKWYQLYRWMWDNGYFYNNESSCDEQMFFSCNVGKFIHLFLFLSCFRNIRLL